MIFITFLQLHVNLQLPPNLKKKKLNFKILSIQLSANSPGKAAEDGPSFCAPAPT